MNVPNGIFHNINKKTQPPDCSDSCEFVLKISMVGNLKRGVNNKIIMPCS